MDIDDFEAKLRAEYEKSPALSPFARVPLSSELAARHGTRSYARAQDRVTQKDGTL